MLNRLPREAPSFAELVREIGSPPPALVARALGVSERTVRRWTAGKAPRTARLCLWWLSCEGHSAWSAEMANRTQLALATNAALWQEVGSLRRSLALQGTATAVALSPVLPRT